MCGAEEELNALLQSDEEFRRTYERINERTEARAIEMERSHEARPSVVTIPVVVHVVHKNGPDNISDDQIRSQIDVLNADFTARNADLGSVPSAFRPVIGNPRIQFQLARRDPNGAATTGITRTVTTVSSFAHDSAASSGPARNPVKFASSGGADAWPRDQYLNIWVCELRGGLLGYASFPGMPELEDGVVVDYRAFGTTGTATSPFDLGRTATHEVGHWLNLRHIWGDDGTACTGTDFVDDTPNQSGPNRGCPTHPSRSCGNDGDMFMNYMDYVDDRCMYMFSAGQTLRMDATLDGARSKILESRGLEPQIVSVPGWFGAEDQGAGVAIADIDGNGRPDIVVFHVDNPVGENRGYYRVGWNLDGQGVATGGWSSVKRVPGWFGAEDQGAGVAIADIDGNGRPDIVVFHVDNPAGENRGYYRVGWNLDARGNVTGGWSNVKHVPGWFGAENQGAGLAITDVDGNGRPDLVVFHVDNPAGENRGYYRVGWNLDVRGDVTGGWSNVKHVPGWFGAENQGAGVAVADLDGSGRPDLVVFHVDNPVGENRGYYRIGRNLNARGDVTGGWSAVVPITGWFGAEDQGTGVAVADLDANGRPDLVVFHVDNPVGENRGYYRVVADI